jgi:hypothetical protein
MSKITIVVIVALAVIAVCVTVMTSRNSEVKYKEVRSTAVAVVKNPSSVHRVVNCSSETEQALKHLGLTMNNSAGVKVTQDGNQ